MAVALGWMKVSGDFKINISPRLEAILVVIVLHDFTGINKNVLRNITLTTFYLKLNLQVSLIGQVKFSWNRTKSWTVLKKTVKLLISLLYTNQNFVLIVCLLLKPGSIQDILLALRESWKFNLLLMSLQLQKLSNLVLI